ncbi:MAG: M14 family metallopeptidase [Anaerolineales bacterium]
MPKRNHRLILVCLVGINLLLILFAAGFIWHSQISLKAPLPQKLFPSPTETITPTPSPLALTKTLAPSHPFLSPSPPILTAIPSSTALPDNVQIIGNSAGGLPILVYRFGAGKKERLIVAGIHGGNEYNTILLAEQLIAVLSSHAEIVPKDKTLFILPDLNPDGFERSWDIYGRANAHGVDLNHNFPYRWAQEWNRSNCWHYLTLSGGTSPGSEPETQALMGFLLSHPIEALISYHSAAMGIFPGGNPPFTPSLNLARAIAKVSSYPYPPLDSGCDYSGNLTDWAATLGIASVDIELRNHRDTDLEQNLTILDLFLHW